MRTISGQHPSITITGLELPGDVTAGLVAAEIIDLENIDERKTSNQLLYVSAYSLICSL